VDINACSGVKTGEKLSGGQLPEHDGFSDALAGQ